MLAGMEVPTEKSFLDGAAPLPGEGAMGSDTGGASCVMIESSVAEVMVEDVCERQDRDGAVRVTSEIHRIAPQSDSRDLLIARHDFPVSLSQILA